MNAVLVLDRTTSAD